MKSYLYRRPEHFAVTPLKRLNEFSKFIRDRAWASGSWIEPNVVRDILRQPFAGIGILQDTFHDKAGVPDGRHTRMNCEQVVESSGRLIVDLIPDKDHLGIVLKRGE